MTMLAGESGMADRLIYRPNAIPLQEWEAFSREQQIDYWKRLDAQSREDNPPDPLTIINYFHQGMMLANESFHKAMAMVNNDNLERFLKACSPELLDLFRIEAEKLPPDDNEIAWDNLIRIESCCYAPWITVEEIRQSEQQERRQFRNGLQLFRNAMTRNRT